MQFGDSSEAKLLIRQLQYLVSLAKYGHFGRAAQACWVSQPTLSSAISQLELELGTSLVQRGHRFYGLTRDGEVVLNWSRRILADCEAMRDELKEQPEGITGSLRLGGIPSALPVVPILTTQMARQHPRCNIQVTERLEEALIDELICYEVDCALIYKKSVDETKFQKTLPLFKERYVLLTPADGSLAEKSSVTWEEASAIPLCLPAQHTRIRNIIDSFIDPNHQNSIQIETDSLLALCAHVCSGDWSTIMPHAFLYPFGAPNGTKTISIQGEKGSEDICLAAMQGATLPPLVRELFRIANETDMVREIRAALGLPINAPNELRPEFDAKDMGLNV